MLSSLAARRKITVLSPCSLSNSNSIVILIVILPSAAPHGSHVLYCSSRCGWVCADVTEPTEANTRTNWQMAQICQRVETWRLKRRLSSHSGGVGVGCAAAAARPSSAACATASTRPALVTSSTYSPQKKPPSGKSSTASQSASLQHAQAAKLKKGCGAAASRSSVARGSSSRPHHKASSSPASAAAFLTAASTSLPFFSFSVLRLPQWCQPLASRSHTRYM